MPDFAITIGAYGMPDFVALNLAQCRRLFPEDTEFLVSDDLSEASQLIREAAEEYDASYVCPTKRRSHFTGDWQSFINASVWGNQVGARYCLKLSQRFIPLEGFPRVLVAPFEHDSIQVVLPARPEKRQMARPQVNFYSGFGLLTDCVCWRTDAIDKHLLEQAYRGKLKDKNDKPHFRMVECMWGWLIDKKLKATLLPQLANHEFGKKKLYLRKAQSNRGEYLQLAKELGVKGQFDLREWALIEGRRYVRLSAII